MKYFIRVFGCAANTADSERIAATYAHRNWQETKNIHDADEVILVTCMIRQSAEDRVLGLIRNLTKEKKKGRKVRIIVTGCMVGMAVRDFSGKMIKNLQKRMPAVDQFLPIEDVGFDTVQLRGSTHHALVLISNGCNNFCSYCVVPFARGKEISRPFEDIINECKTLVGQGYTSITLIGQNVNSYGSDIVQQLPKDKELMIQGKAIKPIFVKHLGKMRIPTLFPYLLESVAMIPGIKHIDFISSNPWDFSDALIRVIAKYQTISRVIHLPVQSGDTTVLKRMNRWYTPRAYIRLVEKIRKHVPDVIFSTDIIVGFPGETKRQFQHTVDLCTAVGFAKAYIG